MKKSKLVILIKILSIVTICLISFGGIYVQELNSTKNIVNDIVNDYKFSGDLKGYREVVLEAKIEEEEEEKTTEAENTTGEENLTNETVSENKTAENSVEGNVEENKEDNKKEEKKESKLEKIEKAKKILEDRLKLLEIEEYDLALDKKTGNIYIRLPENSETDSIVSNLKESGKFEIKDSEDGTILLDNSKIKDARVKYNTAEKGTTVYLEVEFNKEGAEILKDISTNKYAKPKEEEKDENTTSEGNTTAEENTTTEGNTTSEEKKEENNTTVEENTTSDENSKSEENTSENEEKKENKITLTMSGNDITTTSFQEPLTTGLLQLSMNQASTDTDEINSYLKSANKLAINLKKGPLDVEYTTLRNRYVETNISTKSINYVIIAIITILAVLLIIMIIKYKGRGVLAAICFAGFLALYLLLIRFTNVIISIESILGITIILVINYIVNYNLLKVEKGDEAKYNKKYIETIFKIIPLLIVSIVFTFIKWTPISTMGMTLLWGIILILLYNRFIAKHIID